jgi:hypothetical protein
MEKREFLLRIVGEKKEKKLSLHRMVACSKICLPESCLHRTRSKSPHKKSIKVVCCESEINVHKIQARSEEKKQTANFYGSDCKNRKKEKRHIKHAKKISFNFSRVYTRMAINIAFVKD